MPSECGTCSLCCKVLGVEQAPDEPPSSVLPKPAGKWCVACKPGAPGGGCTIHDAQPQHCRDWECSWVANDFPDIFRPDRIHLIVSGESKRLNAYVVHVDPAYPEAPSGKNATKFLNALTTHGRFPNVVIICGDRPRRYIGDANSMAKAIAAAGKLYEQGLIKVLD